MTKKYFLNFLLRTKDHFAPVMNYGPLHKLSKVMHVTTQPQMSKKLNIIMIISVITGNFVIGRMPRKLYGTEMYLSEACLVRFESMEHFFFKYPVLYNIPLNALRKEQLHRFKVNRGDVLTKQFLRESQ